MHHRYGDGLERCGIIIVYCYDNARTTLCREQDFRAEGRTKFPGPEALDYDDNNNNNIILGNIFRPVFYSLIAAVVVCIQFKKYISHPYCAGTERKNELFFSYRGH